MSYPAGKPRRDLTGQKFGRLIVLGLTGKSKRGQVVWLCQCQCGNTREIVTSALTTRNSTSCGCLQKENQREAMRRKSEETFARKQEGETRVLSDKPRKSNGWEASFNRLLHTYEGGAKSRYLDFLLTGEEFLTLTSGNCFYCGVSPKQIVKEAAYNCSYVYNGIDRVDNTKGYTTDNCVPCCRRCNRAKDKMSQEEFLKLIKSIYENCGLGDR